MICNQKLNAKATELFTRGRKLSISLAFFTKPPLKVLKDIRPNCTYFLLWKFEITDKLKKLQ